ncbi:MAG: hypothetical protein IID37_17265 [Planctomycetes bacterium]|nr:hypothetical protein [Planctomycetota bacterium]
MADPDQGFPGDIPYDPDSDADVLVMLDFDNDPTNDDPFNPDPNKLIFLVGNTIAEGDSGIIQFNIVIDVATVPVRSDGSPYFVRVVISDGVNSPVNVYADGTINVVQAASGSLVDLGTVGKTTAGARFTGFNPGANLGSSMTGVGDFDDDGVADFVLVAQFGNPRNYGLVGEAYEVVDEVGGQTTALNGDACANFSLELILDDDLTLDVAFLGFVAPDITDPHQWTAQLSVDDLFGCLILECLAFDLLLEGFCFLVEQITPVLEGGGPKLNLPLLGDRLDGGSGVCSSLGGDNEA